MGILAGKAVVITGSGRGIGAHTAVRAAAQGAKVVVNDIDQASAKETTAKIRDNGGTAATLVGDISSWEFAKELVNFCVQQFGALDGLVNNAAEFRMALPDEETERDFRRIVEVNVLGTAYCGIHAIRQMTRQGRGSLVNTTSGSQAGIAYQASYSATKGAVASLTYSWAADLCGTGIRVNAISPMADTRMAGVTTEYLRQHGKTPWPRPSATPDNNSPAVCYLLSDVSANINGQVLRIDGKRLSLMTHPAVLYPPIERAEWTEEDMRDIFDSQLAERQMPLGIVCLDATIRPYHLAYAVSDKERK